MLNVKFTNAFGSDCFTQDKIYATKTTPSGLSVVDDKGDEHIIATVKNEFKSFEDDSFFRNNFAWIEEVVI